MDNIEDLFTETTRHYVGNSFLMLGWGIAAVWLTRYHEVVWWVCLGTILLVWLIITYRWVYCKFPRNRHTMNVYFTKGLLKYGLLGATLFYFLLSGWNGLLSLNIIVLLLTYLHDVVGLAKVIAVVEKEISENG